MHDGTENLPSPKRDYQTPPVRQPEAALIRRFIEVYCRKQHRGQADLCADCRGLLTYALERLTLCPYHPKPACRRCPTHCYQPERRAQIRQVMRSSGMYFVRRGRWDWLIRYFLLTRILDRRQLKIWRQRQYRTVETAKSTNHRIERRTQIP